jgi:hypothetical protein
MKAGWNDLRIFVIPALVAFGVAFFLSPVWGGKVLFWIALIVGIISVLGIFGTLQQPPKRAIRKETCLMCRKEILTEAATLGLQQMFLAQNNPVSAANIERMSGYYCQACGKKYCKNCLETRAPAHGHGGKACPGCGGNFAVMR